MTSGATSAYQAGSEKQLFFDDVLVESARGVRLVLNPPRKTGERCLVSDRPWEDFYAGGWNTVLEDAGTFKMWYEASTLVDGRHSQSVCYATSTDGIHWEKPDLDLIEFRGSRRNNIVLFDVAGTVFLDPRSGAGERFGFAARADWVRPIYSRTTPEVGIWIFTSPDGLRWRPLKDGPVIKDRGNFDTQNQIFWDPRLRKYVAYVRLNQPLRKVGRAESSDRLNWTKPEVVFSYDSADPVESDHYNPCAVLYPYAAGVYLMFPSAFYHYPAKTIDGPLDIQLATSRDGIRWDRRFRAPYVRLGLEGEFRRRIDLHDGGDAAARRRDLDVLHGLRIHSWRLRPGAHATQGRGEPAGAAYGRLRFGRCAAHGGRVHHRTPALRRKHARTKSRYRGAGLGGRRTARMHRAVRWRASQSADCEPLRCNSVRRRVRWRGDPLLASLAGKPVRLRFVLQGVKLYAFQFSST